MLNCELCFPGEETVLFRDEKLRVILVDDPVYPGFCRIIWQQHIKEMSDLSEADRQHLFAWLMHTERAVREVLNPDKINLASLGNMVPHLHWHVIPRFADDAHFPAPIWATAARDSKRSAPSDLAERLRAALPGG
ncbi:MULTISPECIES: HIT family protein [unclassified Paludibacterium]|uniref:HIT family protein n=1 Tax=unclassified Paludibacterium TaxID=2618429 RepID=UPI001C056200|nr:HIT family protein [Paludibacterium sp. B53371]